MKDDRRAALAALVAEVTTERTAAGLPTGVTLGVGWATVELDRAAQELGGGFVDAPGDATLGAFCRVEAEGPAGSPPVVLLEPSTEGRLAASLARHGEGPLAVWFAAAGDSTIGHEAWSSAEAGPFGQERLILGGGPGGPHVLLVAVAPGTIPP